MIDKHPLLVAVAAVALIAAVALAWAAATGQRPSLAGNRCDVIVPATAAPPVEFEDDTP